MFGARRKNKTKTNIHEGGLALVLSTAGLMCGKASEVCSRHGEYGGGDAGEKLVDAVTIQALEHALVCGTPERRNKGDVTPRPLLVLNFPREQMEALLPGHAAEVWMRGGGWGEGVGRLGAGQHQQMAADQRVPWQERARLLQRGSEHTIKALSTNAQLRHSLVKHLKGEVWQGCNGFRPRHVRRLVRVGDYVELGWLCLFRDAES